MDCIELDIDIDIDIARNKGIEWLPKRSKPAEQDGEGDYI